MSCPPPASDNSGPPREPTDFQSLSATAASHARKQRAAEPTDFQALARASAARKREEPRYERRTGTDWLIDISVPILIFLMVFAVVFFLIDMHEVHIGGYSARDLEHRLLRFVAVFFLIGVVALNRLVASEGSEESLLYTAGLVMAVGFYTLAQPKLFPVAPGLPAFMDSPWTFTFLNMTITAFIWWSTNRLMHECCLDENVTAGDIGILTGTAQRIQRAVARDPGAERQGWFGKEEPAPMILTNELEAVDPAAWKKPEKQPQHHVATADQRLAKRHPGISVLYYATLALAVFAVGLRITQHGGRWMVLAGYFYLVLFLTAALLLLLLTSLGGLRGYFRARRTPLPQKLGWWWLGLGLAMTAVVLTAAAQLPRPGLPSSAYVQEYDGQRYRVDGGVMLLFAPASQVEELSQSRFMQHASWTGLGLLGLFLAYAALKGLGAVFAWLARRRGLLPRPLRTLFNALDAALQRLTRMPAIPKAKRIARIRRSQAKSMQYASPLSTDAGAQLGANGMVIHAYEAIRALAADAGAPASKAQTPYEFLDSFPKRLERLYEHAEQLTGLYLQAVYSNVPLTPDVEDRLRRFWLDYRRVRNHIVR